MKLSLSTIDIKLGAVLAMLLSAGTLAGCDGKADQAACTKMVEHDYGILDSNTHMSDSDAGKKLLEELKKKEMDACVGKMTNSEIECHLKATKAKEMDACDKK